MNPIVASDKLDRTHVWSEDDKSVSWTGAFAVYGEHGATQSSTIVYEIEPGNRLGWHTDATEETQYIIAGDGKLFLEDGTTISLDPAAFLSSRRESDTTWRTSVRKPCGPWPFLRPLCLRKILTM